MLLSIHTQRLTMWIFHSKAVGGVTYVISQDGKPGPVLTELYTRLRAIQYGDVADPYGWITVLE